MVKCSQCENRTEGIGDHVEHLKEHGIPESISHYVAKQDERLTRLEEHKHQ
jgi:hypothetical protein